MTTFSALGGEGKALIGMVHLGPLPGSPRDEGNLKEVIRRAVDDARALYEGGIQGVMVENFFDAPFVKTGVPPWTVSAMTAAVLAVRDSVPCPVGINVLRNDVAAAIAIAHVCGAHFVRCNVYVGAVVADQGIIEGAARDAVLVRRNLGADVQIWADVSVKHSRPLGEEDAASSAADAVDRGLADALIVSGTATGSAPSVNDLRRVCDAVPEVPLLVGSGLSEENAVQLLTYARGAIVGSSLKVGGRIDAAVDSAKTAALVRLISR
jgi:membrane complex biogenesis BtpA family protein